MDDSDDEIFIDVIPRVDDAAADSAVSRLKDKFKDVAKDVGPEFMDALSSSGVLEQLGTKMGSVISDSVGQPLRDMSSAIGVDLDDAIGKALNKDWTGLGTSLGKGLGGKIGQALGLEDALGGLDEVIGKAHTLADTFKSFRSGDLSGGLGGASGLLGALGLPGGGALDEISRNFDQVKGLVDEVKGLSEGTGLASLLAGPEVALPLLGATALAGPGGIADRIGTGLFNAGVGHVPALDIPSAVGYKIPDGPQQPIVSPFDQPRMGSLSPVAALPSLPAFAPLDMPSDPKNPTGRTGISHSDDLPARSGSANVEAQQANVSAGSATVVASSVSLGGVSLSSLGVGSSASSVPSARPAAGAPVLNTPHGPTSFTNPLDLLAPKDKHSEGGILPGDAPGYDNMIGVLPSGGMVGLEGTEGVLNPKAMGIPGVPSLVSQLNKGFDSGTGGPGGVGGDPNNTTLSTPPTTPNNAGGGNGPIQPQQFGSGQGGGISGGGIIGAAEQAGVAAAGVAGFGGGSIAAQMAVQESNLAVQKSTQMVAALATAPFETFGLGGGMMGAPTVNPMGGWIGKLVGGALGQMNQIPNLAGSVQPPKKPDQKPDDQQPQGESPSGPSGDKDDPMHVKVTNPQQPQQGSATSAMSTLPAMTMSVP
jgi:hypothetical protein